MRLVQEGGQAREGAQPRRFNYLIFVTQDGETRKRNLCEVWQSILGKGLVKIPFRRRPFRLIMRAYCSHSTRKIEHKILENQVSPTSTTTYPSRGGVCFPAGYTPVMLSPHTYLPMRRGSQNRFTQITLTLSSIPRQTEDIPHPHHAGIFHVGISPVRRPTTRRHSRAAMRTNILNFHQMSTEKQYTTSRERCNGKMEGSSRGGKCEK